MYLPRLITANDFRAIPSAEGLEKLGDNISWSLRQEVHAKIRTFIFRNVKVIRSVSEDDN